MYILGASYVTHKYELFIFFILACAFRCTHQSLVQLQPGWAENIARRTHEVLDFSNIESSISVHPNLFPHKLMHIYHIRGKLVAPH
jgi:hypothetical protein